MTDLRVGHFLLYKRSGNVVQKKLPLINSAHGSDTRNIINEIIGTLNDLGYTYNESLAMAREILDEAKQTNNINKAVDERLDILVLESGTSDAEVIDARGNHKVLRNRLESTENKIPDIANSSTALNLENPYGNKQNIHPKVLHFPNGLFGYEYWMAYTPYPNGDVKKENPCIAVSHDGLNWRLPHELDSTVPDGMLEDWNGVENDYNNDTHLLYRSDTGTLEVWYRTAYADGYAELKRRTSQDGKTWTAIEVLHSGERAGDDHLSPAVIFEDGKYKMLSVNTESTRTLNYSESTNAINWSPRTQVTADWNGLTPWHMDFIKDEGIYKMVMQAWDVGENNNTSSLYYMESEDLINWSKPIKILSPTKYEKGFDNQGIYRSSLVRVNGVYHLYYSSVGADSTRAIALSRGKSIHALKGYTQDWNDITEIKVKDSTTTKAVVLKQNFNTNNILDVKQSQSTEKYGGMKLGNLLFADGTSDGVVPEDGALRFDPTQGVHQRYTESVDGGTWQLSSPKTLLFARKSTSQSLSDGVFSDIEFDQHNFIDDSIGFTDNKTLTLPSEGIYRISVGINIVGAVDGAAVEVQVRKGTANDRLLHRSGISTDNGVYFVNCVGVTVGGDTVISIKYSGGSGASTTAYPTQNFIFVERVV